MTSKPSENVKNPSSQKTPSLSNFDLFCEKLNVNIEMREGETWIAFDSINECTDESVSSYLTSLKSIYPNDKFRALNRTTGRLVDFI